jgi:hypothetical protein
LSKVGGADGKRIILSYADNDAFVKSLAELKVESVDDSGEPEGESDMSVVVSKWEGIHESEFAMRIAITDPASDATRSINTRMQPWHQQHSKIAKKIPDRTGSQYAPERQRNRVELGKHRLVLAALIIDAIFESRHNDVGIFNEILLARAAPSQGVPRAPVADVKGRTEAEHHFKSQDRHKPSVEECASEQEASRQFDNGRWQQDRSQVQ